MAVSQLRPERWTERIKRALSPLARPQTPALFCRFCKQPTNTQIQCPNNAALIVPLVLGVVSRSLVAHDDLVLVATRGQKHACAVAGHPVPSSTARLQPAGISMRSLAVLIAIHAIVDNVASSPHRPQVPTFILSCAGNRHTHSVHLFTTASYSALVTTVRMTLAERRWSRKVDEGMINLISYRLVA